MTADELKEKYHRTKGRCVYCGAKVAAEFDPMSPKGFDHVIPLSKGGRHERRNLVVACRGCNIAKGARADYSPSEFAVWLRRRNLTVRAFAASVGVGRDYASAWSRGSVVQTRFFAKIKTAYPRFPRRLIGP